MLSLASCVSRVVVLLATVLVTTSITMSGEWGEEGVTYGQVGEDVTLTCAGASPDTQVEWRWNGAPLWPEDSGAQENRLLLLHAELSSEGTYSCHDANELLLSSTILRLGRFPGVPSISCRASNYESFSCFWASSVETFLPTKYITTYRKKTTEDEKQRSQTSDVGLCIQDPALPHSCTVNKAGFWSSYRINVTEVNPLGSSFRLLDITMQAISEFCPWEEQKEEGTELGGVANTTEDRIRIQKDLDRLERWAETNKMNCNRDKCKVLHLAKPDPPEGLRVEPVPSSPRRLHVSWEYPSSWIPKPHFQLKFRLQYRPIIYSSWSVVETVNMSELITDAFMGLEHVVQVSAKDFLDAGSWSEWSAEAWGTPATGQTAAPGEAATEATEPESPAEEPSLVPNNEPVAGHSDPAEKVAVLVSLGVFAFFILAVILVFGFLMWIRVKKHSKEATKHHDLLAAAIHMKALPKAQIL